MKIFLLMQAFALSPLPPSEPLPAVTIIVDAGHGGSNTGRTMEIFHNGKFRKIVEKVYTCDVAARFIPLVFETDWNFDSTTWGECLDEPRDGDLFDVPISDYDRQYRTTGKPVREGSSGLRELLKVIPFSEAARDTIFISIHFDFANTTEDQGAFIIVPTRKIPPLALSLEREFSKQGLRREFCPGTKASIVVNNECYLENLLLPRESPLCQTVLIELGNMRNHRDRALMLSSVGRQHYAEIIARAVKEHVRNPKRCAE